MTAQVEQLLAEFGNELTGPVDAALVGRSVAGGKDRLRRRRAVQAGTVAATVTVAATLTAQLTPVFGRAGHGDESVLAPAGEPPNPGGSKATAPAVAAPPDAGSTSVNESELAAARWFRVTGRGPDGKPDTTWYSRNPNSRVRSRYNGQVTLSGPSTFSLNNTPRYTAIGWDALNSVPADPAALRKILDPSGTRPNIVRKTSLELLENSPARLALRRALVSLVSVGATVTPNVTDSLGRSATRITRANSESIYGGDESWFIQPQTDRVLESTYLQYSTLYLSWGTDPPPPVTPCAQQSAPARGDPGPPYSCPTP